MHFRDQTIYALSSGRPPSAIAIVRVSGPQVPAALVALAGKLPAPRMATRALLRDARGQPIDDAVVLYFPKPASVTGEDVAEFHVHGSRAVLASLLDSLSAMANVRAAEPGEFTRRAFEQGKLDLTEAEGLDDLIHADTDRQRRQALRQLKGLLGEKARDWRTRIIEVQALIEAGIDFSDESDVPSEVTTPALQKIKTLLGEVQAVLAGRGRSERLREGLVVAIAGPPNVGKSTLMNHLARREVAIVSPHAGTTRDIIEVQLDLDGFPVTVIDTAGIRESDDPIEQEGVRRARARAAEADLVLWLTEGDGVQAPQEASAPVWLVRNKIDLGGPHQQTLGGQRTFAVSARRGDGLSGLMSALVEFAEAYFGAAEGGLIARVRQRELLEQAAASLEQSMSAVNQGEEFAAEELRSAAFALGRLLGQVDVEDILDVIFRDFCIGK